MWEHDQQLDHIFKTTVAELICPRRSRMTHPVGVGVGILALSGVLLMIASRAYQKYVETHSVLVLASFITTLERCVNSHLMRIWLVGMVMRRL